MNHEPYVDDFVGITCECGEMRKDETWIEHWVRVTHQLDPELLRSYMDVWVLLATQDRDNLKEYFPESVDLIGHYDGYAQAARDVLMFLEEGRFDVGAKPAIKVPEKVL